MLRLDGMWNDLESDVPHREIAEETGRLETAPDIRVIIRDKNEMIETKRFRGLQHKFDSKRGRDMEGIVGILFTTVNTLLKSAFP